MVTNIDIIVLSDEASKSDEQKGEYRMLEVMDEMAISEKEMKLLMNFVKDDLKEARDSEDVEKKKKVKKSEYLFNDFELDKFRKTGKKIQGLQRYKGLGEMDDVQLWETTLDPDSRVLAQVSISDTVEADEVTDVLMGSNVPPRRQFIMEEARYANVDI